MRKVHMTRRLCSQKGFTLIELMAVLAILAIILAIAVPSIGKILDKAEQSADDSAIDLIEHAGELADVDKEPHDTVVAPPGGDEFSVPEKDSYSVPTLVKKGYLKLDKDSKFYAPGEYVTKKNKGGEYVYKGKAGKGTDDGAVPGPSNPVGFVKPVDVIASCDAAKEAGYDKCLYTLADVQSMQNDLTLRYIVMNNIDLGSVDWVPFTWTDENGGFTGELNGNGYKLNNLTMDRSDDGNIGLFDLIDNGLIQNIWFDDASVTGGSNIGILAGQVHDAATVTNVVASGVVNGSGDTTGLLAGSNTGRVSNAYSLGDVRSTAEMVGGLIGKSYGLVETSYSAANVVGDGSSPQSVGGLIGDGSTAGGLATYATGDVSGELGAIGGLIGTTGSYAVSDAYATGQVSSAGGSVGGLVGENRTALLDVFATGAVKSTGDLVGGLVGLNNGQVTRAYAEGGVSSPGSRVGGLIGHSTLSINDVYAIGNVDGLGSDVGGLIGKNDGDLSDGYATGSVTSSGDNVGGLIGLGTTAVFGDVYATGDVATTGDFVGGLVGSLVTQLAPGAYATGDVRADGDFVGGLLGYYSGDDITDVYATGNVSSGGDNTGGLLGQSRGGDIRRSYYMGSIDSSGNNVGGLVGDNVAMISDSYAIADITASGSAVGGVVGMVTYGNLTNVYASGLVPGDALFGSTERYLPMANNSYWNHESGASSAFGEGRSASQLKEQATFAGWDFDSVWKIESGKMPELR